MKGFKSINEFTLAECQNFLQRNDKDLVLCEHVYARMERLLREQEKQDDDMFSSCRTLENYQEYNSKYPNGRHIQESRQIIERLIWEKYSKSSKLCQTYIAKYPNSIFIEEARKKLSEYQKKEKSRRAKRWCFFALGLIVSFVSLFIYPFKTACLCGTLFVQHQWTLQELVACCLVVLLGVMFLSIFLTLLAWVVIKRNKKNRIIFKSAKAIGRKSPSMFFLYGISVISLSFLACSKIGLVDCYWIINGDEVEYRDYIYNSNGELIATPATSDSISYPDDWSTNGELDTKSMPLMYDNDKIKPNDIDKTSNRPQYIKR